MASNVSCSTRDEDALEFCSGHFGLSLCVCVCVRVRVMLLA